MAKYFPEAVAKYLYNELRKPYTPINLKNATPRELEIDRRDREYYEASRPVVADYQELGYDIVNLDELCSLQKYLDDIQVLELAVKWLPFVKQATVKETLLRIISNNIQTGNRLEEVIPLIVREWTRATPKDHGIRQTIGNIFMKYPREKYYEQMLSLARNDAKLDLGDIGSSDRGFIVTALAKTKNVPRVYQDLVLLSKDQMLVLDTIEGFGILKDPRALPWLRKKLIDKSMYSGKYADRADDTYVRKLIETAIAKIENAQKKLKKS